MKFIQLIAIATLMLAAQSAFAEFKTVARASEVRLSEFRLPSSPNGIASFKACSSCSMRTVNVTTATRYRLNNEEVSLHDMRRSLATVLGRDSMTVSVMHDLKSDLITLISVSL